MLRTAASVGSAPTGTVLYFNEIFAVSEEVPSADGRTYLRLADGRGWAFDDSCLMPCNPSVKRGRLQTVATCPVQVVSAPPFGMCGAQVESVAPPEAAKRRRRRKRGGMKRNKNKRLAAILKSCSNEEDEEGDDEDEAESEQEKGDHAEQKRPEKLSELELDTQVPSDSDAQSEVESVTVSDADALVS